MRFRLAAILAALAAALVPLSGAAQTPCAIAAVFEPFREMVGPDIVGACSGAAVESPAGELTQVTTGGILTRKPDGLVLFTNETTTWLAGPEGLQSRANADRLPWESPVEQAVGAAPGNPPGGTISSASPGPSTKSSAALEQRCSDIIASIPDRGAPTRDQQWGICVNLAEEYGAPGVDCYADATRRIAPNIGKISRETTNALFDAALTVCKGSIR